LSSSLSFVEKKFLHFLLPICGKFTRALLAHQIFFSIMWKVKQFLNGWFLTNTICITSISFRTNITSFPSTFFSLKNGGLSQIFSKNGKFQQTFSDFCSLPFSYSKILFGQKQAISTTTDYYWRIGISIEVIPKASYWNRTLHNKIDKHHQNNRRHLIGLFHSTFHIYTFDSLNLKSLSLCVADQH
jgi:hypothetical protein